MAGGILLLDEATSALDEQSELHIISSLYDRKSKGASSIMISHRLASVQYCDEIIVIRDGNIVERGTHSELLNNNEWYANAWILQNKQSVTTISTTDFYIAS